MARSVSWKGQRKRRRRQALQFLCLPLLILLHVAFTIFSLVLRLSEASETTRKSHRPETPPNGELRRPKHVALLLLSSKSKQHGTGNTSWTKNSFIRHLWIRVQIWRPTTLRYLRLPRRSLRRSARNDEYAVCIESVKRLVQWAGDRGVKELSVFHDAGMMDTCRDELIREYQQLPASPPSSRSPSPPRYSKQDSSASASSSKTYAQAAKSHRPPLASSRPHEDVTSLTLFPSASRQNTLTLHLLSSTTRNLIGSITKQYSETQITLDEINQVRVDNDIKSALHFSSDPELIIIHRTSQLSFLRALLPRSPPELGGYPFWPLRITEIYQHPTRLPFPIVLGDILDPILDRAKRSSLTLLRRTARRIPSVKKSRRPIPGVLEREEWDGALKAFNKVEQRLGK